MRPPIVNRFLLGSVRLQRHCLQAHRSLPLRQKVKTVVCAVMVVETATQPVAAKAVVGLVMAMIIIL